MREPKEVLDRFYQESWNVLLHAFPPRLASGTLPPSPLPGLPDPAPLSARLAVTPFRDEMRDLAAEICAHRFPLLGVHVATGPEICWRRDYVNNRETGLGYFRTIPYLDFDRAGDHKTIWELNRHQHLVVLAQAYRIDGKRALLEELWRQLESWLDANPFQRGINWASALEVAFRALSWIWIWHLVGNEMPVALQPRFLEGLMRHGRHLEVNLSFHFSPNTHLLGEAVALHALGLLFPAFPRAQRWRDVGARVVREQLDKQVHRDGSHFEQSTYYHVYALDMFLFHGILAGADRAYRDRVARMANYLHAVQGSSRQLPFFGDDDGGRFFHPFGARDHFGRATLASCAVWLNRTDLPYEEEDLWPQAAWWLGCTQREASQDAASEPVSSCGPTSRLFADSGLAVMAAGDRHILIDAGPFGPGGSGHSHSDTLSMVVRVGGREILVDAGTFTYVGDRGDRDWFRGSSAHNTIQIDERDQASPVNPFRWSEQPVVSVVEWKTTDLDDFLDAQCVSRGFTHRRRVRFVKPDVLLIVDEISGPPGEHFIEQFWHLTSTRDRDRIVTSGVAESVEAWRSPVFGVKVPAPALEVRQKARLPLTLAAAVLLGHERMPVEIEVTQTQVTFSFAGRAESFAVR